MNLLDENFPDDQRDLLRKFGVSVRQVGHEVGRFGISDEEIIPLVLRFRNATFFTHDRDFSGSRFCRRVDRITLRPGTPMQHLGNVPR